MLLEKISSWVKGNTQEGSPSSMQNVILFIKDAWLCYNHEGWITDMLAMAH